jgi:hypothetical protein
MMTKHRAILARESRVIFFSVFPVIQDSFTTQGLRRNRISYLTLDAERLTSGSRPAAIRTMPPTRPETQTRLAR